MHNHRFDLDVDPGPADDHYDPSTQMLHVIERIAALDDIKFRFWCAKTLAVNMGSVTPLSDAEDVVVHVVTAAIDHGEPSDRAYILHLGDDRQMVAVQHDGHVGAPEDFDDLIFAAVTLPDQSSREIAIRQLARTTGFDGNDEALAVALRMLTDWIGQSRCPAPAS